MEDYWFAKQEDRKNGQRASYLIYLYKHCTELCKKRGLYTTLSYTIGYALILWICSYIGCGTLFSTDRNWKLNYPICMYQAPKDVSGFDGKLIYISSCSNGPLREWSIGAGGNTPSIASLKILGRKSIIPTLPSTCVNRVHSSSGNWQAVLNLPSPLRQHVEDSSQANVYNMWIRKRKWC